MAAVAVPGIASAAPAVGYDVSHPQCDEDLPRERAFAVVGVNGGLSTRANPCLQEQLTWAWESSGEVDGQPRAQLYLNTANPGQLLDEVTTWPRERRDALRRVRRGELHRVLLAVRLGAGAEQRAVASSPPPPARPGWTASRPGTSGGSTSRR